MFGVPPEHFAIGYVHNDNLPYNMSFKTIAGRYHMVFSDDFLHFLKSQNFFSWIHQNYLVALNWN